MYFASGVYSGIPQIPPTFPEFLIDRFLGQVFNLKGSRSLMKVPEVFTDVKTEPPTRYGYPSQYCPLKFK